jgi:hypothetical protein
VSSWRPFFKPADLSSAPFAFTVYFKELMKSCIEDAFEDLKAAAQRLMPVEGRLIQPGEKGPKSASAVA